MGNQAKVSSIDALDMIRAALVIFLAKARRSVGDAHDEARVMRMWLQFDRMTHWESEVRKRSRVLAQAEQEYMSARLVKNNESALRGRKSLMDKAKRALDEADSKLRRVKQWSQNFDSAADPILKRMEGMKQFIDDEMPRAIAYIVSLQRTLAAYAQGPAPDGSVPSDAPTAADAPAASAESQAEPVSGENL